MDLVLIRHAAVALEEGTCYGHSDIPLADDATVCADAIAARLDALGVPPPDALVTSPLVRCASIADALGVRLTCTPQADADLKEMDFGNWEQQRWDAIDRALLDAWAADFEHARAHGGESVAQFVARVTGWFDAFADGKTRAPVTYVVAHAGVIRAMTAHALGTPMRRGLRWPLDFSGIAWLRAVQPPRRAVPREREWVLVKWNG